MGANSGQPVRPMVQKAHFQKSWSEQTTTNDYVILGTAWDKSGFQIATMLIYNTGDTNDIDYKVLGSLDGTNYDIEIIAATTLGEGENDLVDISNLSEGAYIPYIKIMVESTVDNNHSTVEAFGVSI